MWVYKQTERSLWTVGFYSPDGEWVPESDYPSSDAAALRVRFLNGGPLPADMRPIFALRPDDQVIVQLFDTPDGTVNLGHGVVRFSGAHPEIVVNFDDDTLAGSLCIRLVAVVREVKHG